jgi:transcription initiation factor TFIIIB Brf1 subunit/transcription initiation factor TFIIB
MLRDFFNKLVRFCTPREDFKRDALPEIEDVLERIIANHGRHAVLRHENTEHGPALAVYFGCRRHPERVKLETIEKIYRASKRNINYTASVIYHKYLHEPNAHYDPTPQ